jgi:hypothetical protein
MTTICLDDFQDSLRLYFEMLLMKLKKKQFRKA